MNRPIISIIIPVFNSQAYLNKCLDSIVNQTYSNLEIIVVNDGSTDKSREIIEEYEKFDNRLKIFHKENGGIGSAYNLALKYVTGNLITFVDSDDWANLNLYEELIKIYNDENPDFISFGKIYLNERSERIKLGQNAADKIIQGRDSILKFHFEEMKHPSLGRLFKKELFANIEIFDQNIGIDEMLTPQLLAKCNKAVYTSKVLYNVFLRDNSVSRVDYTPLKIEQTLKVYNFLIEFSHRSLKAYYEYYLFKYLALMRKLYGFCLLNKNNFRKQFVVELFLLYVNAYKKAKSTPFFKKKNIVKKLFFNPCINKTLPGFINRILN